MKLPAVCYEKAFWVVVVALIGSFSSGIAAVQAQIDVVNDRSIENAVLLSERTEPIDKIQSIDDRTQLIYGNQRVICFALEVDCQ